VYLNLLDATGFVELYLNCWMIGLLCFVVYLWIFESCLMDNLKNSLWGKLITLIGGKFDNFDFFI
jgi:hypothetical protein